MLLYCPLNSCNTEVWLPDNLSKKATHPADVTLRHLPRSSTFNVELFPNTVPNTSNPSSLILWPYKSNVSSTDTGLNSDLNSVPQMDVLIDPDSLVEPISNDFNDLFLAIEYSAAKANSALSSMPLE